MEPVHMEAVTTETPQAEVIGRTSFNIVSKHNVDPHTFFGAITDPGNSVINIQHDSTSHKFVCTRMINGGNGPRPATGSNVAAGKRINCVVITGIPFLPANPSELSRMLNSIITVDLAIALQDGLNGPVHLRSQPNVGYYLQIPGDEEYDVPNKLKATMPHELGYYSKLANTLNYSRFTVSQKYIDMLTNPPAKGLSLRQVFDNIEGIKQILNFNESE